MLHRKPFFFYQLQIISYIYLTLNIFYSELVNREISRQLKAPTTFVVYLILYSAASLPYHDNIYTMTMRI